MLSFIFRKSLVNSEINSLPRGSAYITRVPPPCGVWISWRKNERRRKSSRVDRRVPQRNFLYAPEGFKYFTRKNLGADWGCAGWNPQSVSITRERFSSLQSRVGRWKTRRKNMQRHRRFSMERERGALGARKEKEGERGREREKREWRRGWKHKHPPFAHFYAETSPLSSFLRDFKPKHPLGPGDGSQYFFPLPFSRGIRLRIVEKRYYNFRRSIGDKRETFHVSINLLLTPLSSFPFLSFHF